MKSDILGIIGGGQLGMFMCIAAKKIEPRTKTVLKELPILYTDDLCLFGVDLTIV